MINIKRCGSCSHSKSMRKGNLKIECLLHDIIVYSNSICNNYEPNKSYLQKEKLETIKEQIGFIESVLK